MINAKTSINTQQMTLAFNKAASQYHTAALLQQEIGQRLIERLQDIDIKPKTVVDLGCGTGFLLQKLSAIFAKSHAIGIDIAPAMVKIAQSHAPRWFSRQHFICADAHALPLANHSVDLIISNLMLQWCPDFKAVLRECQRALTPNGVLLFATLGPETLTELRQSWAQVDDYNHVNQFIDIYQLGDFLFQLGMKNPVLDVDWITECFPDGMEMMRQLKTIGAHNVTAGRAKGLTGKQGLQKMLHHYERYRMAEGLPATYEVIYGLAYGGEKTPTADRVHFNPK
jgi:malonyl-CoA O-methyltransferase